MSRRAQPGSRSPLRTGVIGFGTAGRVFHAPFLEADPAYELTAIVTGDEGRRLEAASLHPRAHLLASPAELFDMAERLDLVVIATPPATHAPLAHRALDQRMPVVVDKPVTVTAGEGSALVERAAHLGVPITVFQNRRWDGDFLTLRRLLADGALGEVRHFESRFEWWKPQEPKQWKVEATPADGGGALYDLGTHLIDQAIQLFGPVADVHAELTVHRPGGGSDDHAFVSLLHMSGMRSHLTMNAMTAQVGPRLRVLGSTAAYTKWGKDVQEGALKAGAAPDGADFGVEDEAAWGWLGVDGALERVPTVRGRYAAFYAALALALRAGAPLPVDPRGAVEVISVLERIHRTTELRVVNR